MDIEWVEEQVSRSKIRSNADGECSIKIPNGFSVKSAGQPIEVQSENGISRFGVRAKEALEISKAH